MLLRSFFRTIVAEAQIRSNECVQYMVKNALNIRAKIKHL